ncbi:MAG: hypothetical protein ACXQTI_03570 [Candidatus Nezhaarchaeales archaeon]
MGEVFTYRTRGVIVCYDLKTEEVVEGRGRIPRSPLRVIRGLIEAGKVERVQNSVLLIKRASALEQVLKALRPYASRLLVAHSPDILLEYRHG